MVARGLTSLLVFLSLGMPEISLAQESFGPWKREGQLAVTTRPLPSRIAVDRNFTDAEQKIFETLAERTTEPIPEMPLSQAMTLLSERHGIPILLHSPSLEAETLTGEETVKLEIGDLPLRSALKLLLNDVQGIPLRCEIEDDVLWVISDVESGHFCRIYDVRPLVGDGDPNELIEILLHTHLPSLAWFEIGDGDGTIHAFRGNLIISQTQDAHEDIEALLNMLLRQLRENPDSPDWSPYAKQRREDRHKAESQMSGIGLPRPAEAASEAPAPGTGMFLVPAEGNASPWKQDCR